MPERARRLRLVVLALLLLGLGPAALYGDEQSSSFRSSPSGYGQGGAKNSSASFGNSCTTEDTGGTGLQSAAFSGGCGQESATPFPAAVTDLAVAGISASSVTLVWTAPRADYENSTGTVTQYLIRYSTTGPIATEAAFSTATAVSNSLSPLPPGARESFLVTGLAAATTHYFAIESVNSYGVQSALSNSASTRTLESPGCVVTKNVGAGQAFATITAALADLKANNNPLSGHSCVIVRDGATYAEQVTVEGFTNNGSSITILADPASGLRPVVDPPISSTAAFFVKNASVNIYGIDIKPTVDPLAYGVYASSAFVTISSVNVDAGGSPSNKVWGAGARLGDWSTVEYSSLTVQAAHGLWLAGSTNTVSFSTIANNSSSHNALYLVAADSNTITRVRVDNPSGFAARLETGSDRNLISHSTITSAGAAYMALYLLASDSNTVTASVMSNPNGYGASFNTGADYNTISDSTMTSASSNGYGLYASAADWNKVLRSYVFNSAGYAAYFAAGSDFNLVSQSTMVSNGTAHAALAMASADNNTVTGSVMHSPSCPAISLLTGSDYNTISFSTAISATFVFGAVELTAADTNTLTGLYVQNLPGSGLLLMSGSDLNAVSVSTMIADSAGNFAFIATASDRNTVSSSFMRNPSGYAASIQSGADSNLVALSTMVSNTPTYSALYVNASDSNTVTGSYVENLSGHAAYILNGADLNVVSLSTVVSDGAGFAGIWMQASSSNTVVDSHIQGSTSAWVHGSTGSYFGGSVLVATNTAGAALALTNGSVNLTLTTSTLRAPGLGRGLALDPGNRGLVALASVTISGGRYGLAFSTMAGGSVAIDSVTFRGLAPGATAIHFLGGTFVSTITLAGFEDSSVAINVNGAPLDAASRVTMKFAKGVRRGPSFENDPNSLVDWDLAAPGAPSFAAVYRSSITVAYGVVSCDGYLVEASTRSDFQAGTIVSSATTNPALGALTPQNLFPNTTYFVRVAAQYGAGFVYNASEPSTSTLARPPTDLQVYGIWVTSITANWKALPTAAQDASSMSAEGYLLQLSTNTDFNTLWTDTATPNVALSTLTALSLYGGNTYYFRVGALNWNGVPNYSVAVSTLLPIQLGVYLTTHTLAIPGLVNMNFELVITTSIIATNTGNVAERYRLRITTTTSGSPWQVAASTGVDRYTAWAVVNSTQPAAYDFGPEDKLADPETDATGAVYTMGNETATALMPGAQRTLWFKLNTPSATSTGAAQQLEIRATAVPSP